ncbi:MAG: DUF423 domain-containing protein [Alphaproteobacteria bacterium]
MKPWLLLAALNGFLAVGAGALATHAAPDAGGAKMAETGSHYQMFHALALLAVAWLRERYPSRSAVTIAGVLFCAGILLFSLPLYALGLAGIHIPLVAPVGGTAFLLGWLAMAWVAAGGGEPEHGSGKS